MSQAQSPLLSIIIVSYNVRDLLLDCLSSLQQFVTVPHEVIVIDNASADDTCAIVKEKFPAVQLIESETNRGFSAANNLGFRIAKGNFVLMLNPDAALIDQSLDKALEFLNGKTGELLLIGPRIFNADKSFQQSAWKFPGVGKHFLESIFLNKLFAEADYPDLERTGEMKPVDFISGAAILVRKETLDRIGDLDEHLFWMDDVDFCFRNHQLGGETIYFPQWQIIHHIGQSSGKNPAVVISNQLISKLKFYRKHGRKAAFLTSVFIFTLHVLLRLFLLLPVSLFSKRAFMKWKAYLFTAKKIYRYLFLKDMRVT